MSHTASSGSEVMAPIPFSVSSDRGVSQVNNDVVILNINSVGLLEEYFKSLPFIITIVALGLLAATVPSRKVLKNMRLICI
jgi:hypothetical protein